MFTYGSPRVGDINFSEYVNYLINGHNLRAVYRDDPVAAVPAFSMGYTHIGTKV